MEEQTIALDERTCVDLLDLECVGRVAFVVDGRPHVQLVAYVRQGRRLEFGAAPGSPLARLAPGAPVALQIDRVDRDLMRGWSVVATGECAVDAPLSDGSHQVGLAWIALTGRWVGRVGRALEVQVEGRRVQVPVGAR